MLQRDYSELTVSSPRSLYGAAAGETQLWQHGWRALRTSAKAALAPLSAAAHALHRWRREAVTIRELSALRDRELRDIGIERSEIPSIARSMADERMAKPPKARIAPILKVVPRQGPAQPCCS